MSQTTEAWIHEIDQLSDYEIPDGPAMSVPPGQDVGNLIDNANAGTILILEDGNHKIGRITQSAGVTVMARNKHQAVIKAGSGDTISMMDGARLQETLFRGLLIEASGRSAVMTLSEKPPYKFNFLDCTIDGGYNHATGQGRDSKWGLMIHRWAGYAARCELQNIKREHGAYIHTPMSDILLYRNLSWRTGRTSYQFVGRNTEAGYADIQIHVKDCILKDPGLRDGGAALTVQGIGELLVEDTEFLIGMERDFRDEYMENNPAKMAFSTGAIVNWDDQGRASPTKKITLRDVNIFSHPGDGQTKSVEVSNCDALHLEHRVYITTGYNNTALEVTNGMPIDTSLIGDYKLGPKPDGGKIVLL